MRLETANFRPRVRVRSADGPGKRELQVGMTGREGMTGLPVVLGEDCAKHNMYIQAAGAGQRMSASKLRQWRNALGCNIGSCAA